MNQNKEVQFVDLNLVEYKQAWDLQETLLNRIATVKLANRGLSEDSKDATDNFLLFCQHPHVYTLGKSGDESHLLLQESFLSTIGATYFKTNRGGDITYHGPGQLVGYPILDLENFYTDIHLYLRMLEEAIIKTCEGYGLVAGRIEGLTGVWINPTQEDARKICAMGVKNVNTDLSYFSHIVPCGIATRGVTSLQQELGQEMDFQSVSDVVKGHLVDLFKMELVDVSRETLNG
jgi:lipoyl(octanoyl) transferase